MVTQLSQFSSQHLPGSDCSVALIQVVNIVTLLGQECTDRCSLCPGPNREKPEERRKKREEQSKQKYIQHGILISSDTSTY